jgi:hypothetical protein
MTLKNMRRLMAMGTMVTSTLVSSSIEETPYRPIRWQTAEPVKATKDRSKIKAARKQNRIRK